MGGVIQGPPQPQGQVLQKLIEGGRRTYTDPQCNLVGLTDQVQVIPKQAETVIWSSPATLGSSLVVYADPNGNFDLFQFFDTVIRVYASVGNVRALIAQGRIWQLTGQNSGPSITGPASRICVARNIVADKIDVTLQISPQIAFFLSPNTPINVSFALFGREPSWLSASEDDFAIVNNGASGAPFPGFSPGISTNFLPISTMPAKIARLFGSADPANPSTVYACLGVANPATLPLIAALIPPIPVAPGNVFSISFDRPIPVSMNVPNGDTAIGLFWSTSYGGSSAAPSLAPDPGPPGARLWGGLGAQYC